MAKKEGPPPHRMPKASVAVLPAVIAGWFSVRAADKASEKADQSTAKAQQTADDLAVSYQLMKQALEIVQHESDEYRKSLQYTTNLMVRLLAQKRAPNA